MAKYRVRPDFLAKYPDATTLVKTPEGNYDSVALGGKSMSVPVKATKDVPAYTREVRGATQSDLEYLYKEGNPHIEQVIETKAIPESK